MAKQTLNNDKDYIKWENVGQKVSGILLRLEVSKHKTYKGELAILQTENGTVFCSAPIQLAEILRNNFDKLHGEYVEIRFVGELEVSGGKMKQFEVDYDDGTE